MVLWSNFFLGPKEKAVPVIVVVNIIHIIVCNFLFFVLWVAGVFRCTSQCLSIRTVYELGGGEPVLLLLIGALALTGIIVLMVVSAIGDAAKVAILNKNVSLIALAFNIFCFLLAPLISVAAIGSHNNKFVAVARSARRLIDIGACNVCDCSCSDGSLSGVNAALVILLLISLAVWVLNLVVMGWGLILTLQGASSSGGSSTKNNDDDYTKPPPKKSNP